MLKSEYRIGRVWGIPINIHISLLLLLIYLAFPQVSDSTRNHGLVSGFISLLKVTIQLALVFGSIALHELGHSFVAIRKGCRVHEITLMFIGGAAKMDRMPDKPKDECLMAIAGPLVSLFLSIIGIGSGYPLYMFGPGLLHLLGQVLLVAGAVNLLLALFNLIPAFPMDGGRVFRALLTTRYGRLKATYIASKIGRALAITFFIIGVFGIGDGHFFHAKNPSLILISIFIFITANREYRMVQVEELMKQRGFGAAWPGMASAPPPDEPDDDTVIISPPPYAKGPAAKAELHHTKSRRGDNPFSRLFRR